MMPRMPGPLTDEDREKIASMLAEQDGDRPKYKQAQIADHVGCAQSMVAKVAAEARLTRPRGRPEGVESLRGRAAVVLARAGFSATEIGGLLGISRQAAADFVKRGTP